MRVQVVHRSIVTYIENKNNIILPTSKYKEQNKEGEGDEGEGDGIIEAMMRRSKKKTMLICLRMESEQRRERRWYNRGDDEKK